MRRALYSPQGLTCARAHASDGSVYSVGYRSVDICALMVGDQKESAREGEEFAEERLHP